ncbi:pentapeptide repeat-containing protein [Nonomuraea sp. AD125B]|uniref:pentapeptide repeat-containing protein n=1 Tax=Nonomuraea sp. AD125B TaxID=3242897 RepID=UPI00352824D4
MKYDLSSMGERDFEALCRALAVHVLGPGIQAFGDGPDGGREASFDGQLNYPSSPADGWNGYGILQCKFRRTRVGLKDAEWLIREISKELGLWADPDGARATQGRVPEYIIIATNVRLSGGAGKGGIDQVVAVLRRHAKEMRLKDWSLWDGNQLVAYLDAYPQVSAKFSHFTTPGDVLARLSDSLVRLDSGKPLPQQLYLEASAKIQNSDAITARSAIDTLDWLGDAEPSMRQKIINTLCHYLRYPSRQTDQEVRAFAQGVIQRRISGVNERYDYLPAGEVWSDLDLDLRGSHLTDFTLLGGVVGRVLFSRARFTGDAILRGVTFQHDADFSQANFGGSADFTACTFTLGGNFEGSGFVGDATFHRAQFSGLADFSRAHCCDEISFRRTIFDHASSFDSVVFDRTAVFEEAVFGDSVNFSNSKFLEYGQFRRATFRAGVSFLDAQCLGKMDLGHVRNYGNYLFSQIWPPGWSAPYESCVAVARDEEVQRLSSMETQDGLCPFCSSDRGCKYDDDLL